MDNENSSEANNIVELRKAETYASHKTASQNLLNTSIIQNYVGLLVFVYSNNKDEYNFGKALIVLIYIAFTVQFIIFVLLNILLYIKQTHKFESVSLDAKKLNVFVTVLSGISLVLNIAITTVALEVKDSDSTNSTS